MIEFSQDENILNLEARPTDQHGNAITPQNGSWAIGDPDLLQIVGSGGPENRQAQIAHVSHNKLGQTTVTFSYDGGQLTEQISITAGAPAGGSIVKL